MIRTTLNLYSIDLGFFQELDEKLSKINKYTIYRIEKAPSVQKREEKRANIIRRIKHLFNQSLSILIEVMVYFVFRNKLQIFPVKNDNPYWKHNQSLTYKTYEDILLSEDIRNKNFLSNLYDNSFLEDSLRENPDLYESRLLVAKMLYSIIKTEYLLVLKHFFDSLLYKEVILKNIERKCSVSFAESFNRSAQEFANSWLRFSYF